MPRPLRRGFFICGKVGVSVGGLDSGLCRNDGGVKEEEVRKGEDGLPPSREKGKGKGEDGFPLSREKGRVREKSGRATAGRPYNGQR